MCVDYGILHYTAHLSACLCALMEAAVLRLRLRAGGYAKGQSSDKALSIQVTLKKECSFGLRTMVLLKLPLRARGNGIFPLAGDADVLVFACWSSTISAVEVSKYGGIASFTARLLGWFVAVSKGDLGQFSG